MIKKVSETEWEFCSPDMIRVEATVNGLKFNDLFESMVITWGDLDKAKHEAEKANLPKDPFDSLAEYLRFHERDIAIGTNDFGDLASCFYEIIGRLPKIE